ncbi:hypothetical protein ACJMK2_020195 [Sinanodonta woodiana]|uniref:NADP-dependent oxidoreductase domain-containing protein n=1 Tax=Sinanodonta woodiana TaxID=1069815 RepID=A0ABD3TYB4_SINWO
MASSEVAEKLQLAEGVHMPVIGLGTWTVFGERGDAQQVKNAVKAAIDAGCRLIDCAWNYGNETEIGEALQEKFNEGTVKRDDIFITTKLWDTHHNPKLVKPALQDSLRKLKVDCVDLYLFHWPVSFKDGDEIVPRDEHGNVIFSYHDHLDTWKAMEECVDAGLAKTIGISNFNSKQIERVLANARIKPVNLQIEVSPYFQNSRIIDFSKSHGLTVTAYAPFGNPARPWKEADQPNALEDETLQKLADKKGKSVAQVILRWHLQRGLAVVPKSITPSRIKQNMEVFDFELNEEEMDVIAKLDRNMRVYVEPIALSHPDYPFKEPF